MKQYNSQLQAQPIAVSDARLLTDVDLAAMLQLSVGHVRNWRLERKGPPFRKIGAAVRYDPAAVREWLERQPTGGGSLESAA